MWLLSISKENKHDDSIIVLAFRFNEWSDAYMTMIDLAKGESALPCTMDIRDSNGEVRAIRRIAATKSMESPA